LPEVHRSIPVPERGRWLRRFLAFAGPLAWFVASVIVALNVKLLADTVLL
jgi:hypothetical protein